MADPSTVDYSMTGFWTLKNLTHSPEVIGFEDDYEGLYLCKRYNLVSFEGKLLALWDDALAVEDSLSYRLPVDYLLVTGKQNPDVQSIVNGYEAKTLLIDGSVPYYLAERWASQAQALNILYYNIGDGALEVEF
jgi:hypothetical protein